MENASKIIISGLVVVSGLLAHQLKLQMVESERLRAALKTQNEYHTRIIKRLMDGGKLGPHFFCERQIIKSQNGNILRYFDPKIM